MTENTDYARTWGEIQDAETLFRQIPETAPSFTATVEDPVGWDGIPCLVYTLLHHRYFPDCLVGVSEPASGGMAVMGRITSLMMLAVGHGATVKFQCDTDPKTFETLRRCICLLFRRSDKPGYGKTYDECLQLLQECSGKGPEHLLLELTRVTQMEGRTVLLREQR